MKKKDKAYDLIVLNGDDYLKSNLLDQAQIEYIKALDIHEHGKWAKIGLTKIMIKKMQSRENILQ